MNPIGPRNLQLNCSISALGASRAGVSQNNASIQEEESHENESKGYQESDDGDLSLDDMLDPLEQFRTSILGRVTVLFVIQIALSVLVKFHTRKLKWTKGANAKLLQIKTFR